MTNQTYTVVTASGHVAEVPFPLKPEQIAGSLSRDMQGAAYAGDDLTEWGDDDAKR